MNKKTTKEFEIKIAQMKTAVSESINKLNKEIDDVENLDTGVDVNDHSAKVNELSRLKNLKRQQETRSLQIKSAEIRLSTGKFGICISCEDDIPMQRLVANPCSLRCLSCQEEQEFESRENKLKAKSGFSPDALQNEED